MRVHEGDFVYDIEPVTDRGTLLFQHYQVTVLKKETFDFVRIFKGTANTLDEAREMAEQKLRAAAGGKAA